MFKFKNNLFCNNCGKNNHKINTCNEPIISYGIICYYQDKIVLVRRKYTIAYINLLMGKYNVNDIKEIAVLFSRLTRNELTDILTLMDFDKLRDKIGLKFITQAHRNEYENSKVKFTYIKDMNIIENVINIIDDIFNENFKSLISSNNFNFNLPRDTLNNIKKNITHKEIFEEPEWEIPKGKRFRRENNINVAIREFVEETDLNNINIFKNVIPLEEEIVSISNIKYKYVYYLASINNIDISSKNNIDNNNIFIDINEDNEEQAREISKVGFICINDIENYLRSYQIEKKKVIYKSYQIYNNFSSFFN